jgi:hypothetical protein
VISPPLAASILSNLYNFRTTESNELKNLRVALRNDRRRYNSNLAFNSRGGKEKNQQQYDYFMTYLIGFVAPMEHRYIVASICLNTRPIGFFENDNWSLDFKHFSASG